MNIIIAIDGPAGSGKGTLAKALSKKLNLVNIDTGATYRCVALAALRNNIKADDETNIVKLLDKLDIKIENEGKTDIVYLNEEDVTSQIRSKEVTAIVPIVSSIIKVREKMVSVQRNMASGKNIIAEGRDIGTIVFPNADVKIYLDATPEERARRRMRDLSNQNITFQEVLENIKKRDENDKNKKVGALKMAEDSIYIDTTNLSIEEVVARVQEIIAKKKQQDLDNER